MSTKIKDVQMYFRLSLPREAYSLLDEAMIYDPILVYEIVEKAKLDDVKSTDQQWWTLLVSLFAIGKQHSEYQTGRYPIWFYGWWVENYLHLTEWELCDETVFGGYENVSMFDGTRCVSIDY